MEEEIWKPAYGHPNYMVSSLGRVWSNRRRQFLRPHMLRNGYLRVWLGRDQHSLLHRLVLSSFVGFDPGRPWVNHKNGVRAENCLQNLEWVTAQENIRHKIDVLGQGRLDTHPRARFSNHEIMRIRERLQSGETERALAAEYGVAHSTIHAIRSRQNWKRL